jgi:hypothetical protein
VRFEVVSRTFQTSIVHGSALLGRGLANSPLGSSVLPLPCGLIANWNLPCGARPVSAKVKPLLGHEILASDADQSKAASLRLWGTGTFVTPKNARVREREPVILSPKITAALVAHGVRQAMRQR